MDSKTLDKEYIARIETPYDLEIIKTEGSYIIDRSQKKYIDLIMGWCVGNLGWGNEELRKRIRNYKGPDYVYPNFIYEPWAELARLLVELAPGGLNKCFRATGGSEAVDAAMQVAMAYTGRSKFLSIGESYHGNTIATLSIGALENKKNIKNHLTGCMHLELPLNKQAIKKLETRLKNKDIAAFIMEPVICNAGVHIPDKEFMQAARKLCTKYGTLLVMDEVATGFGRTGKLFATEHFEIAPDMMTLAKGITGGYAGLGALLATDKITSKIKNKVKIYSSYGWHPLSTEVAIANARYYVKNKNTLLKKVTDLSQKFRTRLSSVNFKNKGMMNIIGLAISVDVGDAKYAENIRKNCFKKRLLITAQEKQLVMFPPLNINERTIDKAIDILEECV